MRCALCLVPVLSVSAIVLAGCGYAGEPKAPALRRPVKVTDLAAVERGAKIVVTFTLPQETTEGLPISGSPDVELRVGAMPAPWNQDAWQASSDRVPMPAWQVPPPGAMAASGSPVRRVRTGGASGAGGASGKKSKLGLAKAPAKPVKPAALLPPKALLFRTVEIDAAKYFDKATVIGLRVHGPQGREDGWSMVTLDVFQPLPVPRNLRPVDAPNAVHLNWSGDAPAFRIFRRPQSANATEADWVRIGDSTRASFDDATADYGKAVQYYVQAVRQVGSRWLESDPSETITFTPTDRFPPAVPTGLIVISGVRTAELAWDPVTDSDLAGYRVYRNGVKIADAVAKNSYSDMDVSVGSKYSYQVSAVDQAGNESAKCAAQEITME